jgi:hypothetical protein
MKKIDIDAIHRKLHDAVDFYERGHQVEVLDENRQVLHRTEYPKKITERPDFLEILAATQTARGTFIVHDVPAEYWNRSHWPQTLKAANDAYLHRRFVTGRSAESDS